MKTINTIIIDKHADYSGSLVNTIHNFPQINLLGIAVGYNEAVKMIKELQPDLVFLSIDFTKVNETAIFQLLKQNNIALIYLNVSESNAIKLLQYDYLDGMTKEITEDKLKRAFHRFHTWYSTVAISPRYNSEKATLTNDPYKFGKIVLPHVKGYYFANLNEIIYLQAEGNYTAIRTLPGENILSSRTLKFFENILPKETFYRSHKSYIINLNMVKNAVRDNGLQVVMEQGVKLDIADRNRKGFLNRVMPLAKLGKE